MEQEAPDILGKALATEGTPSLGLGTIPAHTDSLSEPSLTELSAFQGQHLRQFSSRLQVIFDLERKLDHTLGQLFCRKAGKVLKHQLPCSLRPGY